jgi:peptidoglycan/LPS O-acetylase OafA/YrhL
MLVIGTVMRANIFVLSGSVLTHIGKISYGIYLLHMFIRCGLKRLALENDVWLSFFCTAILTILLASLVYTWFEQPIIRFYKKRFAPGAASRDPELAVVTTLAVQGVPTVPQ